MSNHIANSVNCARCRRPGIGHKESRASVERIQEPIRMLAIPVAPASKPTNSPATASCEFTSMNEPRAGVNRPLVVAAYR